jgi:hypothetical protein
MTPEPNAILVEMDRDESSKRRSTFSVTGWGAPGAAGVVVGIVAIATGRPGAGLVGLVVGAAMLWYAHRLYRGGTRL